MADISKINAVLIANIAEIDDVLAANIAKVNGLVFSTAPAFTGLLDTYTGAAAAFSTRRLYGQYTGACMRVRRDSDDTEQDIGFDSNGDLDTSALATFVGSGNNGYVTKWYGQESSGGTGSGNDAVQTTNANQPQIYNGTAVVTENGKPALNCDGATVGLDATFNQTITAQSNFVVAEFVDGASRRVLSQVVQGYALNLDYQGTNHYIPVIRNATNSIASYAGGYKAAKATTNDTQHLLASIHTGSSITNYVNASASSSASATLNTNFYIFRLKLGGNNEGMSGTLQEVVSWSSDQSSNRTGIETNINDHYLIGNFPNPTSGLLYDYSGAAAAYSVRQLANTAALAMRIREDGTDTETDIGFDSNGDLDTAAIASHCGSNNGYVVTWYDQSGNQNDAAQGTSGSQPQIYNGTAVLTENGKPALDFDGSGDYLLSDATWTAADKTVEMVHTGGGTQTEYFWGILNESGGTRARFYLNYNLNGQNKYRFTQGDPAVELASVGATNQNLVYLNWDNSTQGMAIAVDGGTQNTATGNTDVPTGVKYMIGSMNDGSDGPFSPTAPGSFQEIILWNSDESSNRSGIETNINNYFSIY